jgi:hypothetical protein
MSEPAVGICLCDLVSGLVRKLRGTKAKVSKPDVQKNNSAQSSSDGFVQIRKLWSLCASPAALFPL